MIHEALIWATSTSAPAARKAGLVSELAAIAGRYARHKKAWTPHLDNTKAFIQDNLKHAQKNKPILVLGAGLCLDLSLDALNNHAGGAILVDAVLPYTIRRRLRSYHKLHFMHQDITGFLAPFWNSKPGDKITPPDIAPLPSGDYGMVISCNLLSQLPLSYTQSPPRDETEMRLSGAIQLAHMQALQAQECPILLITDHERLEVDNGSNTKIPTVPPHLLPGEPHRSWLWHIAPDGEVRPELDIQLNVGAWLLCGL